MPTKNSLLSYKKKQAGAGKKKVTLKIIDFDNIDKSVKKARKVFEACPDCRKKYKLNSNLSRHKEICDAKTCVECWETFPDMIRPDSDGKRICGRCRREKMKAEARKS